MQSGAGAGRRRGGSGAAAGRNGTGPLCWSAIYFYVYDVATMDSCHAEVCAGPYLLMYTRPTIQVT